MQYVSGGGNGGNKIWVYTFAWNEERMLPFFFDHYLGWLGADVIVVFDNESTDNTAKLCDALYPKVLRVPYATDNTHSELNAMVGIRNSLCDLTRGCADFVVIVDCDEFVYHNDMSRFLQSIKESNTSICRAQGYDMVSTEFPKEGEHLPNVVRTGIATPTYSKPCIFMPDRVDTLLFTPGAHHVTTVGMPEFKLRQFAGLRLLHYPRLGWDFYLDRMMSRRTRVNQRDAVHGLNNHYTRDVAQMREEFDHVLINAVDCVT